jgi:hypothetical protein
VVRHPISLTEVLVNTLSSTATQLANSSPKALLQSSVSPKALIRSYNTLKGLPSPYPFTSKKTDADLYTETWASDRVAGWDSAHKTGFKRFPFGNFTYYLTLFSKFFSSFPHGTCSLSVSCQYLALDGIYHPFWAAFPNNPTL